MVNFYSAVESRRLVQPSVAWRGLHIYGFTRPLEFYESVLTHPISNLRNWIKPIRQARAPVLQALDGLVESGDLVLVIGQPGSGCTTFLKTISGRLEGQEIDPSAQLNYKGLRYHAIRNHFRGDCIYQSDLDFHFPHLTLSQTLNVPARARPQTANEVTSTESSLATAKAEAAASALGLATALNVKVGNDIIPGISGGERRRTSILENLVGRDSCLQCWDNSTKGLDSHSALRFVKLLREKTRLNGSIALLTLYQASDQMYQMFDKVLVLSKGQQIYFGRADAAKAYFEDLGFNCTDRMLTCDFLISVTDPAMRRMRNTGTCHISPDSSLDLAEIWRSSSQRAELLKLVDRYWSQYPFDQVVNSGSQEKRKSSPRNAVNFRSQFITSYPRQVYICLLRAYQRLMNDLAPSISALIGNTILSVVLGSMFYNLPSDSSSFFAREVLIFFVLLNSTFLGAFEGVQLWEQRPITNKHADYAFYRPSTEAVASIICDLPNKLLLTCSLNIPVYFLAHMRRTPSAVFTFLLFAFSCLLTGSMLFRAIGTLSKELTSSIVPGASFILLLIIYLGFVLPIPDMHPWLSWFRYLNPIGYAFESLTANEFAHREFPCTDIIPSGPEYDDQRGGQRKCTVVGANSVSRTIDGGRYIESKFNFHPDHLWRNLGFVFLFMMALCGLHLLSADHVHFRNARDGALHFSRKKNQKLIVSPDEENVAGVDRVRTVSGSNQKVPIYRSTEVRPAKTHDESTQGGVLAWKDVCYDVKAKGGHQRILHDIEGWVRPGSLTALMGASGAGKTTLLNVLSGRISTGVVSGEIQAGLSPRGHSFARDVGYAQQQDMHLETATVREAVVFSALLRQPKEFTKAEKVCYAEDILDLLDLSSLGHALIGIPGKGLNLEQRKRLTIAIELAARPRLLLFLDEPVSGLDSNSAMSICQLLRKLADSGQAILCTIHQPSAALLQSFDRLLLLINGSCAYFGDMGPDFQTLIKYFEYHGASRCKPNENPGDWLMQICNSERSSEKGSLLPNADWCQTWRSSVERQAVLKTLDDVEEKSSTPAPGAGEDNTPPYASSLPCQFIAVAQRSFQRDWRTPSYLYSKMFLVLAAGLINGFSFYSSDNSLQGVQNQIFSIFLLYTLHNNLVQLLLPHYLHIRSLFETREWPSKTYSWAVFYLATLLTEVPWTLLLAVIQFVTWYYPVGLYRNAAAVDQLHERGILAFLVIWSYMLFSTTFSLLIGTLISNSATGVNISSLLFSLSLLFCGVLVPPHALPGFWIFMYRVSPLTYFVNTLVSAGLAGVDVTCAAVEVVRLEPPEGQTCGSYLQDYMLRSGGTLQNANARGDCGFCPVATVDDVLASLGIRSEHRWRDLGISLAYSIANVLGTLAVYWLAHVYRSRQMQRLKKR